MTEQAQRRLLGGSKRPWVIADWHRVLFLHFTISPHELADLVPTPLELELHKGKACLSVVSVTMRHFRGASWFSPAQALRVLGEQRFLNFRTYVRHRDQPGAFFFHGWLSPPFGLPLPSALGGWPYAFGSFSRQPLPAPQNEGRITDAKGNCFAYEIGTGTPENFNLCPASSLAEFAMERYTGFFARVGRVSAFRVCHPAWLQTPVEISITDNSLITSKFEWFKRARFAEAHVARGFPAVWMGPPQPLEKLSSEL